MAVAVSAVVVSVAAVAVFAAAAMVSPALALSALEPFPPMVSLVVSAVKVAHLGSFVPIPLHLALIAAVAVSVELAEI